MNDVMIDIETLGTSADCTILAIAAVRFDRLTGEIGGELHERIDPCGQNRHVCTQTLKWWAKQPQGVFAEAMSGETRLGQALHDLFVFVEPSDLVWAQGTDFDFKVLDHAFDSRMIQKPWPYYAKRDTRTLYDVAGFDPRTIQCEGTLHNALDDCKHQIRCVVAALQKLKGIAN